MNVPRLIAGGLHVDGRGVVRHVNGFGLKAADRFYLISPARAWEWRGWVGHRRDRKWFFASAGEFVVCVASLKELENSRPLRPVSFRLSDCESNLLEVPPGFATAIQSCVVPAGLMVFSTGHIETAADDILRYPLGDVSHLENAVASGP